MGQSASAVALHDFKTTPGKALKNNPIYLLVVILILHSSFCVGSNASEPSFDLGIEQSQSPDLFVTPKANLFPINVATSPVPFLKSPPPPQMMMVTSKLATPESSTKETAYNIIIDHVDVAEAETDTKDKVSYLLLVDENFVKVSVPEHPDTVPQWKDCPLHATPDLEAVRLLNFWCNNSAGEEHDRY
jgi:hypothetical protein